MSYKIVELNPELAECFVDYLENVDFSHAHHWSTCYCRYYHLDCSSELWQKRTGAENRLEAIEQIKLGKMKGYLAFDGEKCIGWCNANNIKEFLRFKNELDSITQGKKVGCVICFVVHKDYRGKGVARELLKQSIIDFKSNGYDAVIALPVENITEPQKSYRGTLNMYLENGFKEIEKQDSTRIMMLEY